MLYICNMENKIKVIAVRVTDEDLTTLKLKSSEVGLSLSAFLRLSALSKSKIS